MNADGEGRGARQPGGEDVRDYGADLQGGEGKPPGITLPPAPSAAPGRLQSLRSPPSLVTGSLPIAEAVAAFRSTLDGAVPMPSDATGSPVAALQRGAGPGGGRFAPTVPKRPRREKTERPGASAAETMSVAGAGAARTGVDSAAKGSLKGGGRGPPKKHKEKKPGIVALDGSGRESEKPKRLRKGVSFSDLVGEIGGMEGGNAMDVDPPHGAGQRQRGGKPSAELQDASSKSTAPLTTAGPPKVSAGMDPPSLAQMEMPLDDIGLDLFKPARLPLKDHVGPLARSDPFEPGGENLLLFQFPVRMPDVVGVSAPDALPAPQYDPESHQRGVSSLGRLRNVPSGRMGRLKIHKSGKMMLHLGNLVFDVSRGKECSFYEFVADLQTDGGPGLGESSVIPETATHAEAAHALYALGEVQEHFKVCPNVGILVRQAAMRRGQYGRDAVAAGRSAAGAFRH